MTSIHMHANAGEWKHKIMRRSVAFYCAPEFMFGEL